MADTNLLVLAREYKKLREEVKKVLSMPKGDKGDKGEKGDKGDTGDTGLQGFPGRDGKDGINGYDGKEGRDGVDGKDGKDGLDGVGVANAYIDFDNSLVIVLTDGREVNAGFLSQETKDNVVATFKQGAATINELLPPQAGNANKFLKTDGTDVSWDTLDGSDINLSSPPVIGNVTPNAGTFTTLTATGQASLGGAAGAESLRVVTGASNVNFIQAQGSSSGNQVYMLPGGTDTNTSFAIASKGNGNLNLYTNASTRQALIAHTASAVNYVQVTGAATGGRAIISTQGSDASPALDIVLKGTPTGPGFRIQNQGAAGTCFAVTTSVGSIANHPRAEPSIAGNAVGFSAQGSDTNISQVFQSKGTGAINLAPGSSGVNISNGGTVTALTFTAAGNAYTSFPSLVISAPTTAGGVQATATLNRLFQNIATVASGGTGYTVGDVLTVVGGTPAGSAATLTVSSVSGGVITAVASANFAQYTALPSNPVSVTGGTGTGATLNLQWSVLTGAGSVTITNAGSGYVEQPTVTFSGGGGSGAAAYATVGGTPIIKGLGANLDFYTANTGIGMRLEDTGGGVATSYFRLRATTGAAQLLSTASMSISSTGANNISLLTNGITAEQLRVAHTASAVNFVQVTGAATGGRPTLSAQGSDTNVGLTFIGKGNARAAAFFNNSASTSWQLSVGVAGATNAVNFLDVSGSAAGAAPVLSAQGNDTNIDLALTPKGTGLVRFGTYTAGALSIAGYIEIKDAGGTTRRLAVVA